jgi:hypothetical protein
VQSQNVGYTFKCPSSQLPMEPSCISLFSYSSCQGRWLQLISFTSFRKIYSSIEQQPRKYKEIRLIEYREFQYIGPSLTNVRLERFNSFYKTTFAVILLSEVFFVRPRPLKHSLGSESLDYKPPFYNPPRQPQFKTNITLQPSSPPVQGRPSV